MSNGKTGSMRRNAKWRSHVGGEYRTTGAWRAKPNPWQISTKPANEISEYSPFQAPSPIRWMIRARNDGATMATEWMPRNNASPAISSVIAWCSLLAAWFTKDGLDHGSAGHGVPRFALGARLACSLLTALCGNCRFLRTLGFLRSCGFLRNLAWSGLPVSLLRLGAHCRLLG